MVEVLRLLAGGEAVGLVGDAPRLRQHPRHGLAQAVGGEFAAGHAGYLSPAQDQYVAEGGYCVGRARTLHGERFDHSPLDPLDPVVVALKHFGLGLPARRRVESSGDGPSRQLLRQSAVPQTHTAYAAR